MRYVYAGFSLSLSLELLPKLKEAILYLIFNMRIQLFLSAYEFRLCSSLGWALLFYSHRANPRGFTGRDEECLAFYML